MPKKISYPAVTYNPLCRLTPYTLDKLLIYAAGFAFSLYKFSGGGKYSAFFGVIAVGRIPPEQETFLVVVPAGVFGLAAVVDIYVEPCKPIRIKGPLLILAYVIFNGVDKHRLPWFGVACIVYRPYYIAIVVTDIFSLG